MKTLAMIAGAGALPQALTEALGENRPLICALEGLPPEAVSIDVTWRFERLVPFLRALVDQGIEGIVMAGAIARPVLDPSLFDRETAALVPGFLAAMRGGDDVALRWFISLFEDYGLMVHGIAQIAPGLMIPDGVASLRAPTEAERSDAARGSAILRALDCVDVAQGCVVASGLCLGVEAIYGTDALLSDVARHRPERAPQTGGVFVKRAKAGQDLRADLPTIGPATVAACVAAGLTGLCLEAGRVIVVDRPAVLAAAEAADLALWAAP